MRGAEQHREADSQNHPGRWRHLEAIVAEVLGRAPGLRPRLQQAGTMTPRSSGGSPSRTSGSDDRAAACIDTGLPRDTIGPFAPVTEMRVAMTLTPELLDIAARIDARVQRLVRGGSDNLAVFMAMADRMPDFKRVMDAAGQDGMDELCRQLDGFYRYAKVLETVAAGIAAGEIPVPE